MGNFNNLNGGPDGTNDRVGLEDYNTVINNFGRTTPGAGGLGVVPEPASGLLLLVAAAFGGSLTGRLRVSASQLDR
jgi:hypothetical protein